MCLECVRGTGGGGLAVPRVRSSEPAPYVSSVLAWVSLHVCVRCGWAVGSKGPSPWSPGPPARGPVSPITLNPGAPPPHRSTHPTPQGSSADPMPVSLPSYGPAASPAPSLSPGLGGHVESQHRPESGWSFVPEATFGEPGLDTERSGRASWGAPAALECSHAHPHTLRAPFAHTHLDTPHTLSTPHSAHVRAHPRASSPPSPRTHAWDAPCS